MINSIQYSTFWVPITLLLILENLIPVNGLDCYVCGKDSGFGDCSIFQKNSSFIKSCSDSFYKSCVSAKGKYGDIIVEKRECGTGEVPITSDKCSDMKIGKAKVTVCSCKEKLCNQSNSLESFLFVKIINLAIFATIYFLFNS